MNYIVYWNDALKREGPVDKRGNYFISEEGIPAFHASVKEGDIVEVFCYQYGKLTQRITYICSDTYPLDPIKFKSKDIEFFVLGAFH